MNMKKAQTSLPDRQQAIQLNYEKKESSLLRAENIINIGTEQDNENSKLQQIPPLSPELLSKQSAFVKKPLTNIQLSNKIELQNLHVDLESSEAEADVSTQMDEVMNTKLIIKNIEDPLQKSTNELQHRKIVRILLLVFIELIVIGIFILFYYKLGYRRGIHYINDNTNLHFQMENCILKIHDYSSSLFSNFDLNFLSTSTIPSSISQNILLMYTLPNPHTLGEDSSVEIDQNNLSNLFIKFNNGIDYQQCEVALYVYKQTTIKNFNINCSDQSQCYVISHSKNLFVENLAVVGEQIEFNASYLNVNNLNIDTFYGNVEINNIQFQQATVEVSTGDISIQSTKSILASLEMVKKLYCFSTFSDIPMVDQVVEVPIDQCRNVTQKSSDDSDQLVLIARRCFIGDVSISSNAGDQQQKLTARNTYGNIFINLLQSENTSSYFNKNILFDKTVYGDNGDNVQLSEVSQRKVSGSIEDAKNPKVYDPVFLIVFGSKSTQSNTFTQWQITYNPAYSYLKPWWLGTLSYSLLTTELYQLQLSMSPGFCPYVPSLSKERIFKTQDLLYNTFINESIGKKIITFAWQSTLGLPLLQYVQDATYDGIRKIDLATDYLDSWYSLIKDQDGTIIDDVFTLNRNKILLASLIVSIILSLIVGFLFLLLIIFLINQNYLYLLDYMQHVDTYAQIKNIQLHQEVEIFYGEDQIIHVVEQDEEQKKENQELTRLQSKNQKFFKYTCQTVFDLIYTIVYLSPPLSAYIDQVVLLFYKSQTNSLSRFYELLFTEEKENDNLEIHNLQKDHIDGREIKELYEQFCYLNRLLERKMDEEYNVKILKQYGFKISVKQDALVSFFSYIKYVGFKNILITDERDSLKLFIDTCCSLTRFDCDMIDSLTFEQYYFEFCNKNHLPKEQLNERKLKREFGVETRLLPIQVVERDPQYNLAAHKKYVIDRERVKYNFKLLLISNMQEYKLDGENLASLNRSFIDIYKPRGWFFYDFLTVFAHLCFICLIGCPLIALIVFVRIQESEYTLIPTSTQLYLNDILYNLSVLPKKLMHDNVLCQFITVITAIFWGLCTWDLLYYYYQMSFPQERYFQNYIRAKLVRRVVTRFMWVIVLVAIYIIGVYIFLTLTWLILGAIINPEAFLPYATSAATLIILISTKYKYELDFEYKQLSENGFKIIMEYIKQVSDKQFSEVLKKMNITDGTTSIVPTNKIKDLIGEAAKMNIIDENLCQDLQNNLELMIRDPTTVMSLGKKMYDIAQDPRQYAQDLMSQVEDKVKESLSQQVSQYLPLMGASLIQTIEHQLAGQKQLLKEDLLLLFRDLVAEIESKPQETFLNNKEQTIKIITIFKGPILKLLFDIQFPQENEQVEQIKQNISQNFCTLLSMLISFRKDEIFAQKNYRRAKGGIKEETYKKSYYTQYTQQTRPIISQGDSEHLPEQEEESEFDESIYSDINQNKDQKVKVFQYQTKTNWDDVIYKEKNLKELNELEQIELILNYILDIHKHEKDGNFNDLLNEILSLLNNNQIPKTDKELNSLSHFQDVFNIIVALNENMGILNVNYIQDNVKQFFENNYEIILKNDQKYQIGNLIYHLFKCIFCHMKSKPSQDIETLKQKLVLIERKFDENSNSSGILSTYFTKWIQGQLLDIPINSIKQLLQELSSNFTVFKKLQSIIFSTNNAFQKKSVRLQTRLKKTQTLLYLSDIIMSNPINDFKKQKKNATRIFGVDEQMKKFIPSALKIKFRNLATPKDYNNILDSSIFQKISQHLKLSPQLLIGLLHIINKNIHSKEAITSIKIIFAQNKIQDKWVLPFLNFYGLLRSENEQEMNTYFNYFKFPKFCYYTLDKNQKRISLKHFQENLCLILLNLKGKFGNPTQIPDRVSYAFKKLFGEDVKEEQLTKSLYLNQLFSRIVTDLFLKSKNEKLVREEVFKGFINLATVDSFGVVSSNVVNSIIKIFSLIESENIFSGIQRNEIDIFAQLLSLRNICDVTTDIQTQLQKDSITDISNVLNIDEYQIQNFFYIFTSSNHKIIQEALKQFGIEDIQEDQQQKYVASCASLSQSIQDKWFEINNIQKEFFEQKIPIKLLRDLTLFNKLPSDSESVNFIFETFFKIKSDAIKLLYHFKYNISTDDIIQKIIQKYLYAQKLQEQQAVNFQGLQTIMKIFSNSSSHSQNIQQFLQFLYNTNQDLSLLLGCLYVYFSGESDFVFLEVDLNAIRPSDKSQTSTKINKVSLEQYLSHRLQIKQEFFEAIPSLFVSNTYQYVSQFIKFFRQVDYQVQQQKIRDQKKLGLLVFKHSDNPQVNKSLLNQQLIALDNNNAIKRNSGLLANQVVGRNQTVDFSIRNSNMSDVDNIKMKNNQNNNRFKLQKQEIKNCYNRITVLDKEVEQFIRLISGNSINTSFFSREIGIPIDIIELISAINAIKRSETKEQRYVFYEQLVTNNQVIKIFQKIGVQTDEFLTCLKFYYNDFEVDKQSSLQKGLKLPQTFPYSILQSLLLLKVQLPTFEDPYINMQKLNSVLRTNQIIKDLQNQSVDVDLISLLFALYGDFTIVKTFFSGKFQPIQSSNKQFINIVTGLVGCLNKKKMIMQPGEYFKQVFEKLKNQGKLRNDFTGLKRVETKNNFSENEENLQQSITLKRGNTMEYALFLLCKELYISPIWMLLMQGDYATWQELCKTYYIYYKYEKDDKQRAVNPVQILIIILRFKESPTMIKELLTQNELAILAPHSLPNQPEEMKDNETIKTLQGLTNLQDQQNKILISILGRPIQSFTDLAQVVNFPIKILKLVANYDNQHSQNNVEKTKKLRDFDKYLLDLLEDNPSIGFLDLFSQYNLYDNIKQLFLNLDVEFCDYRVKLNENENKSNVKGIKEIQEKFGFNEIMQLVVTSTLSNLQSSYDGYQELYDRYEQHQQLVCYEIDLLLSTLESFYFFLDGMSEFNKFKIFQVIGLSCGFPLNTQDILACLPQNSINMNAKNINSRNARTEILNKTKFFVNDVLVSLLQTIKKRDKPQHQIKVRQLKTSYFRIINRDVYHLYGEEGSLKELSDPDQLNKYLKDKVENFESYIVKQISISDGESIHSLYMKKQSYALLAKKEIFVSADDKDIFQFLIDLFKENFEEFIEHSYFDVNKENDMKFIEALLFLNSLQTSNKPELDYQRFTECLQIVTSNLSSNKKSLIQLLSLLRNDVEYNLSCIQDVIQVKSSSLNNFLKITLNQEIQDISSLLSQLLQETSYSFYNKRVIYQIALLYTGDVNQLMELVKFSENFDDVNKRSFKDLYKFLQAIDYSNFHTNENEAEKTNILNLQYLSSEKEINQLQQSDILLSLCFSIIYNEEEIKNNYASDELGSTLAFKTKFYSQAKIIGDICQNKWDFIWTLQDNKNYKDYQNTFCNLFQLPENAFNLVELLAILKSDVSGFSDCVGLNYILQAEKLYINYLFYFQKREEFVKKINDNCLKMSGEVDLRQLELLIVLSSQSFPHLVDLLNKYSQIIDEEEDTSSQNISNPRRGTMHITEKVEKLETPEIKPNELSRILQSIILTKFSTQYNWYDTYKQLKEYNSNEENQDHLKEDVDNKRKLMLNILQGYDIFSGICIKDFAQKAKQTRTSNLKLQNQKLLDRNILSESDTFDLEYFLIQQQIKVESINQKSPMILKYLVLSFNESNKFLDLQNKRFGFNQFFQKNDEIIVYPNWSTQMLTSFLIGEPFFFLGNKNKFVHYMQSAASIFLENSISEEFDFDGFKEDQKGQLDKVVDHILPSMGKLFFLTYYSKELSALYDNFFLEQFNSLNSLVILDQKQFQVYSNADLGVIRDFIDKISSIVNLKVKHKGQIGNYIIDLLLKGFPQIEYSFPKSTLNRNFEILFQLLNNPIINLQDFKILDQLMELLGQVDEKYIKKNLIKNLFVLIIKGEVNCLFNIIESLNIIQHSDIAILKASINRIKGLTMYQGENDLDQLKQPNQPILSEQMKDIQKRVEEGKITIMDIFQAIDNAGDRNQLISLSEFCNFLKRAGIQMSEHRTNELFASIKKNRQGEEGVNTDGYELNYEEFEEAYNYITEKKTDMSLQKLGISPTLLAFSLGSLVVILVLLFIFIFLGIKAFALGGTFGSIINSVIPVVSALGAASSQNDKKDSLKEENIKGAVKQTQQIIHTNRL